MEDQTGRSSLTTKSASSRRLFAVKSHSAILSSTADHDPSTNREFARKTVVHDASRNNSPVSETSQPMPATTGISGRREFAVKGYLGTPPTAFSSTDHDRSVNRESARKSTASQHTSRDVSPISNNAFQQTNMRSKGVRPSGKKSVPPARNSNSGAVDGPNSLHHSVSALAISPSSSGHPTQFQDTLTGAHSGASPSDRNRNLPIRKVISAKQSPVQPTTGRRPSLIIPSKPEASSAKSLAPVPFWQYADEQYMKLRGKKRQPNQEERAFVKRVVIASSNRRITAAGQSDGLRAGTDAPHEPNRTKSYLGRHMTLRQQGEEDDESDSSMELDDVPRPSPRRARKTIIHPQTGVKAARKREWPQPLFDSESSDESESSGPPLSDSQDELEYVSAEEVNQLRPEEDADDIDIQAANIVTVAQRPFVEDIKILPPPQGTINLLAQFQEPPVTQVLLTTPNDEMMQAMEALCLPSIRMQKTKQLPFLLRNIRRGFFFRCETLGIETHHTAGRIVFKIHYTLTLSHQKYVLETQLNLWVCPLCALHGTFPSREMLKCHLDWDHDAVPTRWSLEDGEVWFLLVSIPNIPPVRPPTPTVNQHAVSSATPTEGGTRSADGSGLFPFVTLSPTLGPQRTATSIDLTQSPPKLEREVAEILLPSASVPLRERSTTSVTETTTSTPARGRSTTSATTTTTTTATTVTATASVGQTPRPTRRLTPPPRSNPLGPAAQPPYLPAKSEYGGPDIYYSCRPSGACLLDLLNTLPLEPYGVLAWDILDREDEIYDSDNVKDEYKVMHALWGRWIVLNRDKFIRDYHKGTVAFVDCYWKMIHRAAGWDALRYWLLMLVANRYLTGSNVVQILKHYESLTGMDDWYE